MTFGDFIKNFNISQAYAKMVNSKPYKLLSCFAFDWTYAPLKRREMELEKPVTPKPSGRASTATSSKQRRAKSVDLGSNTKGKGKMVMNFTLTREDEAEFTLPSHRYVII